MIEPKTNPIDETNFDKLYNKGGANASNGQLAPPDFTASLFNQDPAQLVTPNPSAYHFKEPVAPIGFGETIAEEWKNTNSLFNAGSFAVNALTDINPIDDTIPEGWTVWEDKNFAGIADKYIPYVASSSSPRDLEARLAKVHDQMYSDERLEDGSMVAKVIGGIAGIATSPETYLIPMSAGLKYARFTENMLANSLKALPSVAAQAGIQEAALESNRVGGNLGDAATNMLRDTIFGAALLGTGTGLVFAKDSANVWNMRKVLNTTNEGVILKTEVNEKGVITGYKAEAMQGQSVSAAQVDQAQQLIDGSMQLGGLFALPFIGEKIADFSGNKLFGSPVIRALRSPSAVIRDFAIRMTGAAPYTMAELEGKAIPDSVEALFDRQKAIATKFTLFVREKFWQANGISGISGTANQLKNIRQKIAQKQNVSEEEFGRQVRSVINTDMPSQIAEVNEVAKMTMNVIRESGRDFNLAHGFSEDFLDPITQANYLMQNYNISEMIQRPEAFDDVVITALKAQDESIERLNAPLDKAKEDIKALEALKKLRTQSKAPEAELKAIRNAITKAKGDNKKAQQAFEDQLRDDPDLAILLENRNQLNSSDRDALKALLTPVNIAQKAIDKQKKVISTLKKNRAATSSRIKKVIEPEAAANQTAKLEKIEADIVAAESRLREYELEHEENMFRLEKDAHEGKIDRKLFYQKDNVITFKDPEIMPKLRASYGTDIERAAQALAWRETITGNTPENILNGILHSMMPDIVERPSYLSKRSIMIKSEDFNQAGFLDPDIAKSVTSYVHTMGRRTAFKKVFNETNGSLGIESLVNLLKNEHDLTNEKLLKEPESKERGKKLMKEKKAFQVNQNLMSDWYNIHTGSYQGSISPELRAYLAIARNYLAAVKLGAVPIAQITDLSAHILKAGLLPFFAQGLRPILQSINGLVKGENSKVMKANAAHAYMALNHVQSGMMDKFFGGSSMSDYPLTGRLKTALSASENLAHASSNFFGTNIIENMNQTIAANYWQSEVMKAMHDFKTGTLSKELNAKMLHYGIDPKEWADKFIENYKAAGGWTEVGGYQSQYYNWGDVHAANRMSMSIQRAVNDTVVRRGMFTSPLWANNPILSSIFMFHGWAYSAFVRYTIPTMQRPDAEKALGFISMVGLGMLTEPLRRLAKGESAFEDEEQWYQSTLKGLSNSGILGPLPEAMEGLNLAMGNSLIPHWLQGERYKERGGVTGALFGPLGGAMNDVASLIGHANKGDITQGDLKKAARLLPFTGSLALRGMINKFIAGTNVPEDRRNAEPWAYRHSIYGEE